MRLQGGGFGLGCDSRGLEMRFGLRFERLEVGLCVCKGGFAMVFRGRGSGGGL